jgi:hypothetical protein
MVMAQTIPKNVCPSNWFIVRNMPASKMEGGQNVALSGRVYALATAANCPIKPGDLLTTSEVPGHAMKATDVARSHGTIIGKAMSRLENGEGLVLVLVNLQ